MTIRSWLGHGQHTGTLARAIIPPSLPPLSPLPPLPRTPEHDEMYHAAVRRVAPLLGQQQLRARRAQAQIDAEIESYGIPQSGTRDER